MSSPGTILAARIRNELPELAIVVGRAKQGWDKARTDFSSSHIYLKAPF